MQDNRQPAVGSYRWVICALLFFATTVNYVDRSVFGVLEPTLKDAIGWTATQFGDINAQFNLAYAIGFLFAGWMIDRLGTRLGYSISLVIWSLAAASHAFARTGREFGAARFALGLGESGNFPAAIKTVAEWFPRKERRLPQESLTRAPTSARSLRPGLCPLSRSAGVGNTPLSAPDWPAWCGSLSGGPSIAPRANTPDFRPQNWHTLKVIHPTRRRKSTGASSFRFVKHGRSRSVSF